MHVPTIQHIAAHMGGEVRNGREAVVPGPGHSAVDRSLSITINDAGDDVLVHSFAGDDPIACKDFVRKKLGLDEWQPKRSGERADIDAKKPCERAVSRPPVDFSAFERSPAADYDYTDDSGNLIYQVRRTAAKKFSQRRPDGNGGWINNLDGVKAVPYRLRELNEFPDATTFIVEGEKDVDRLLGEGLTATTLSGSFKWTDELAELFRGRDIVVLADTSVLRRPLARPRHCMALLPRSAWCCCQICRRKGTFPTGSTPVTARISSSRYVWPRRCSTQPGLPRRCRRRRT